jgi:DNA repair photolyase
VTVQTRSPLVLRDLDILKRGNSFEVGMSVTTADDGMRKLFEPDAPAIKERIRALSELRQAGVRTYAMIAPILPHAESLAEQLVGNVDYVRLDRMNYHYGDWVYRKYGLENFLTDEYFSRTEHALASAFANAGISCL